MLCATSASKGIIKVCEKVPEAVKEGLGDNFFANP